MSLLCVKFLLQVHTILYSVPLSRDTLLKQVHHHDAIYVMVWVALLDVHHHILVQVTVLGHTSSRIHYTAFFVTATRLTLSTSPWPYSTSLLFIKISHKCITKLHITSLPWVTLHLQVYHDMNSTSLPWLTLLLQVHRHSAI